MATIGAVGGPVLHLERVERGLGAHHGDRRQPRRLPGHGILALRIGHVVMEGEPETRTGPGRTATGGDPLRIDVPLGRPRADRLQRPRGVGERGLHGRIDPLGKSLLDKPVLHRGHRDAGVEHGGQHLAELFHPVARQPAAAMDKEHEWCRLLGRRDGGHPDVHHLLGMRPVGNVGQRRRWQAHRWLLRLMLLGAGLRDAGLLGVGLRISRFRRLAAEGDLERILRRAVLIFVDEIPLHISPPAIVCGGEAADDVGMLGGHVVRLGGIGRDVMELPALGTIRHVDEAPPPLADAAVAKLTRGHLAPLPATLVRDERPVGPHGPGIAEEGHEAAAFHVRGDVRRDGHAGEFAERRQHVDVRGHGRHVDALGQRSLPPPERRHPRAPTPDGVLGPTHAGVKHAGPGGRAVVSREHDQCLSGHAEPIKRLEQPADIRVDVLDHAVEPGDPVPLPAVAHPCRCERRVIRLRRALRAVERLVRCVGRDQAEKRLLVFRAAADPRDCLVEEHVGAVARRLDEHAVAADHRIDIPVALDVAAAAGKRLADAPSAVDERAVEAATPRLVGIFVTKVPLAEDTGRVACPPEEIGQRRGREGQPLPLEDRVRDPRAELVPAGEQRRPGRRTGGAGMKLGQPHALPPEPVEVGRLDHWV